MFVTKQIEKPLTTITGEKVEIMTKMQLLCYHLTTWALCDYNLFKLDKVNILTLYIMYFIKIVPVLA